MVFVVLGNIPVGGGHLGMAVRPGRTRADVANAGDGTVSLIDTATDTATATVGSTPFGLAVTPDGTKAHVANLDSNRASGSRLAHRISG